MTALPASFKDNLTHYLINLCKVAENLGKDFKISKCDYNYYERYFLTIRLGDTTVVSDNGLDEHPIFNILGHIEFMTENDVLLGVKFYATKLDWQNCELFDGTYLQSHVFVRYNSFDLYTDDSGVFICCQGSNSPLTVLREWLQSTVYINKDYKPEYYVLDVMTIFDSFYQYMSYESLDGGPHYTINERVQKERIGDTWNFRLSFSERIRGNINISYFEPALEDIRKQDKELRKALPVVQECMTKNNNILYLSVIEIGKKLLDMGIYPDNIMRVKQTHNEYAEILDGLTIERSEHVVSNIKKVTSNFYKYITRANDTLAIEEEDFKYVFDAEIIETMRIIENSSDVIENTVHTVSIRKVFEIIHYYQTYILVYDNS